MTLKNLSIRKYANNLIPLIELKLERNELSNCDKIVDDFKNKPGKYRYIKIACSICDKLKDNQKLIKYLKCLFHICLMILPLIYHWQIKLLMMIHVPQKTFNTL